MSHIHGCKQTPPTPPTTTDEDSSGNTSDDETKKKKGNRAMRKKKYPKAIRYYTKAIKLVPDNPTYRLNRAIANSALELWKDAEADAGQAVELGNPPTSKSHYQLARARLRRGNCDEAREAIERGLAEYPGEVALKQLEKEVERSVAIREAKAKKARDAEAARQAAVTAGPRGSRALLEQARAVYSQGRVEEALTIATKAREAAAAAVAAEVPGSKEAATVRREEASVQSLIGKANMQLRKWSDASEAFQAVVTIEEEVFSMDDKEEREALSNAYNNLGIALKNAGRMKEATETLNKAYHTATSGDDKVATLQAAQILQNAGQCLKVQKRLPEARQMFIRALEVNMRIVGPDHASLGLSHLCVARAFREEGQIKEAIQSYSKALQIWTSKDQKESLAEMPEMPNKERFDQLQMQTKTELAQLLMMIEKANEAAKASEAEAAAPSGAETTDASDAAIEPAA